VRVGLSDLPDGTGNILALGYAAARPKLSRIIALPCGEAGHILKLVRLRKQALAWGNRGGPSISLYSLDTSDQGFWMSTGGAIRQIGVCDSGNEPSPWLAVRQDTLITIFRPTLGQVRPVAVPNTSTGIFPPSRLSVNPVASLSTERHGSDIFVDMSFNPWYTRQFILIDKLGRWSIWSVEGKSQLSTANLVPGKSGSINDGHEIDVLSDVPAPESGDGWHQALWISNLSTIAVCGRNQIAIFDMKARPIRLRSIGLKSERILDTKKSPAGHNHLFVLTNSRIIWVEVKPSGDNESEEPGARVILSQRHFRDSCDNSLKLCILQRDPGA
jgi:RNA polymerase I-specific transcription initiation factor RRN6